MHFDSLHENNNQQPLEWGGGVDLFDAFNDANPNPSTPPREQNKRPRSDNIQGPSPSSASTPTTQHTAEIQDASSGINQHRRKRRRHAVPFLDDMIQIPGAVMRDNLQNCKDLIRDYTTCSDTIPLTKRIIAAQIHVFPSSLSSVPAGMWDIPIPPTQDMDQDMVDVEVMRGESPQQGGDLPDGSRPVGSEEGYDHRALLESRLAQLPWSVHGHTSATMNTSSSTTTELSLDTMDLSRVKRRVSSSIAGSHLSPIADLDLDVMEGAGATETFQLEEASIEGLSARGGGLERKLSTASSDFLRYVGRCLGSRKEIMFDEVLPRKSCGRYAVGCGFSSLLHLVSASVLVVEQAVPYGDIVMGRGTAY